AGSPATAVEAGCAAASTCASMVKCNDKAADHITCCCDGSDDCNPPDVDPAAWTAQVATPGGSGAGPSPPVADNASCKDTHGTPLTCDKDKKGMCYKKWKVGTATADNTVVDAGCAPPATCAKMDKCNDKKDGHMVCCCNSGENCDPPKLPDRKTCHKEDGTVQTCDPGITNCYTIRTNAIDKGLIVKAGCDNYKTHGCVEGAAAIACTMLRDVKDPGCGKETCCCAGDNCNEKAKVEENKYNPPNPACPVKPEKDHSVAAPSTFLLSAAAAMAATAG
ncbi:hypothetical protein PMAYCL1PPCAC_22056, partial [Pristionchus mayeri]